VYICVYVKYRLSSSGYKKCGEIFKKEKCNHIIYRKYVMWREICYCGERERERERERDRERQIERQTERKTDRKSVV
jgi:hypothetical protein